jgi:hypothetical protein
MYLLSAGCVLAAGAAGLVVCMRTASVLATGATMILVLAAGGFPVMRWWLGKSRSAQGGTSPAGYPGWPLTLAVFLVAVIAALFLETQSYEAFHSRLLEAALAALIAISTAFFTSRARARVAPRPEEARVLRFNALMSLLLAVMFGIALVLQLTMRHPDPTDALLSFNIAGELFMIPVMLVGAALTWQRSKRATLPGSALPA